MTRRPYRLTEGSHSRWEDGTQVHYSAGDTIWLTEAEAGAYPYVLHDGRSRVALVEGEVPELPSAPAEAESEPAAAPASPLAHNLSIRNAGEAKELLEDLETVEEVEEFIAAERAGKGRVTVLRAAERAIEEIKVVRED